MCFKSHFGKHAFGLGAIAHIAKTEVRRGVCISGNGILERKSWPDTRGKRKDPCKIGPAPEAFIKNRETPKTRICIFENTPTNMLGNLGLCNTLQLICEAFFAAQTSHFHKCNTLQPICSILSGFAIPPSPFACFHVAKGTPKSRSR